MLIAASACSACSTPARRSARWSTTQRAGRIWCGRSCSSFSPSSPSARSRRTKQRQSGRAGEDRRRGAAARHQRERRDGASLHASDRRGSRVHRRDQPWRSCRRAQAHGAVHAECRRHARARAAARQGPRRVLDPPDLYKTLARIRARTLMRRLRRPRIASAQAGSHSNSAEGAKPADAGDRSFGPGRRGDDDADPQRLHCPALAALNLKTEAWERVSGNAHMAAIGGQRCVRSRAALEPCARRASAQARRRSTPIFDEAYSLSRTRCSRTPSWDRQMLDDSYQELDQHWSVLMLLPNGPYELVLREVVGKPRSRRRRRAAFRPSSSRSSKFRGRWSMHSQSNSRTDEAAGGVSETASHAAQHAEERVSSPTSSTAAVTRSSAGHDMRPALPACNAGRSLFSAIAPTPFRHRRSPLPPFAASLSCSLIS